MGKKHSTPRGRASDCSGNPFCHPAGGKKIAAESAVFSAGCGRKNAPKIS
jgi:hypothetical protein